METANIKESQFLWGLSFGIIFLGIAGAFWLGLGVSSILLLSNDWRPWSLLTLTQLGFLIFFIRATIILRRRSGFNLNKLRSVDEAERLQGKNIRKKFLWLSLGQMVLIVLIVLFCSVLKIVDYTWILIGLVVSLHFLPLARIFKVQAYCVMAISGSLISVLALLGLFKPLTLLYLGIGMSLVMWISAIYIFINAEKISVQAIQK